MTEFGVRSLASLSLFLSSYSPQQFGSIQEKLAQSNPWHGYSTEGVMITLARAQSLPLEPGENCPTWMAAVWEAPTGLNPIEKTSLRAVLENTKPSDHEIDDEYDAIRTCHEYPCKVKLSPSEVSQMAQITPKNGPDSRIEKYWDLIEKRQHDYQNHHIRLAYEYPGTRVEPWAQLSELGYQSVLERPSALHVYSRVLNLSPGQLRAIPQMIDRRATSSKVGYEVTVWLRDIYTAHYFDTWGEWMDLQCNEVKKRVEILQVLHLEFDLLKGTGLLARLGRPKARDAAKVMGWKYLDQTFEDIQARAKVHTKENTKEHSKVR